MNDYGYGLWALVVINSAVFILFAISFFHPQGGRDWRALGGFSAFIVALFAEMYGYPLTIYLAGSVLGDKLGLSHNAGHLWADLVGWKGDPHLSPFHFASWIFIGGGFWLIAAAWTRLHAAAQAGRLATDGAYARIRHPQYAGFIAIMIGFLLQWPTLPTLVMFPILLVVYRRLAIREERDVAAAFGADWDTYGARTPRFIPRRTHGDRRSSYGSQSRGQPGWPAYPPTVTWSPTMPATTSTPTFRTPSRVPTPAGSEASTLRQRTGAIVSSAVAAVLGVLPHVLHHVGPLAGAALLAGTAGTLLFGAIGLIAAIPFLLRVHRRCGNWRVPAALLAAFAVMFSISAFVIGPAISGRDSSTSKSTPNQTVPNAPANGGHDAHHQ